MSAPDPYAGIEQLCHVSSSQEELLRRCRFANESPPPDNPKPSQETEDNDVVSPVEPEGIVMVSLPETPPEEGIRPPSEAEAAPRDSEFLERAVDLGRDTDWVFTSGGEWTEREIRVSGGELGLDSEAGGKLGNLVSCREESSSQLKRLKLGVEERRRREDLGKSVEEPNRVGEVRGGRYSKRKEVGVSDPGLGFSDGRGVRKSIDDIDKFRYVGCGGEGSSRKEMGASGKRTLPASIRGWELKEVSLLHVLKMLGEGSNYDNGGKDLSVLEAAKRRGMTFP